MGLGTYFTVISRKALISAALLLGCGLGIAPAYAAPTASNAAAEAVVVRRLSFITDENFDFGAVIAGATSGTVVVPPAGVRTKTGGPLLIGTLYQPARFSGLGATNQIVQISMGANSYALPRVGGGAPAMTVDTFIIGSTPTAQLTTNPLVFRIASATGIFNFPVGATLRVGANQPPGVYSTTVAITLIYQ
jgi:uncharacterized membrane protein